MKKTKPEKKDIKFVSQKEINRRTFVAFSAFAGFNLLVFGAWKWLQNSPEEVAGVTAGSKKILRRALNKNEILARKLFSNDHLVQTYPKSMAAKEVRVNSEIGIDDEDFNANDWSLLVSKKDGSQLKIGLKELRSLPKTEIIYDFKCVEGWDQISHWGGVKFSDFINHYDLQDESKSAYVGMSTPNGEYYVGLDMPSVMHPQTLLAYEVNEKPLPVQHGYPLRLIIPVKYGIKNLKRIGSINFSDQRPPDYWAERGYDYYSGL